MHPPKALHIVESLNRGAVENWLVRMLRHARTQGLDVDWTFYCALPANGGMDDVVRALGAKVIHSTVPLGDKTGFISGLRDELTRGKYDVLHCHHDLVSAVYLVAAVGIPFRRRIVHVHNADEVIPTPNRMKRWLLREPMRRACLTMSDRIVGISRHVLSSFLRGRPARPGMDVVHYYGVEPEPFVQARLDRATLRRELGFDDDARILLFAGRLVPEKNPLFALNVFHELRRMDPHSVAVFAGAGGLESSLRQQITQRGLETVTRMVGWRSDLPALMTCADWFILPHPEHPMEGFGLAVLEAQLAGLRLLLSHGVGDEPLLPTAVFRRLTLRAHSSEWAAAAIDLAREKAPSREDALAALKQSPMDMDASLEGLMRLHTERAVA